VSAKTVCVVVGAGPAGLTAAVEVQARTDGKPLILEMTGDIGGLSKTVEYKGNRLDIGGHRFFSKSDRVMEIWQKTLPLEGSREAAAAGDNVMLLRQRLSRILFLRELFDYPLRLSPGLLKKLGMATAAQIGASYLRAQITAVRPEATLEDFLINRFGRKLYEIFFRDYTEKVWGVPCRDIPREWGLQRIKGLSVKKVLSHAVNQYLFNKQGVAQKEVQTSLIERFLYPKHGPGQYWQAVAHNITARGGEILHHRQVTGLKVKDNRVWGLEVLNRVSGKTEFMETDAVFSSMPVRDLIEAMGTGAPPVVRKAAGGLLYRDFITVGVLISKNKCVHLPDNWIYVQEKDVRLGRIQIFNNWSPYMVNNSEYLWLGLEYFCTEGDELWRLGDREMGMLAGAELVKIGFISEAAAVEDSVVIRMPKAYPAYFGGYDQFPVIREFTDTIDNLYLIGRNGMHRYNNMDHSMLTAMAAVKVWAAGLTGKEPVWSVNAEAEYHEECRK
jgi:protoporphyrinogen oxidase